MIRQVWQGKVISVDIPFTTAGVAQQVWIAGGNNRILVDTGDGTLRDLLANKHSIESIDGILFTHGHFDHMGGLYSLLGFMRMVGRTHELVIVVPENCREVAEIVSAFDKVYHDTLPFTTVMRYAEDKDILTIGELHITVRSVVHCGSISGAGILDPIPAAGYRIACRGETVAVTGDTGDCAAVRELVTDADLAVVEATFADEDNVEPAVLDKVHLDVKRASEIGSLARNHILVHRRQQF